MIKSKQISSSQKEKILNKCIELISCGYSFEYCEAKFKRYGNVLEEYLPILTGLKKLRRDNLSDAFLKNTLHKIYADCNIQDEDIKNSSSVKIKTGRFHVFLKPAIIFVTVVLFFSFSFIGILFASQNSLPSNPLYPVKRYGENMKLLVAPESRKNILHYQMLNNRLNETTLLLSSPDKQKSKIDITIKDAEEEFNQCKKYDYFGGYTEKEIRDLIEKIKEESVNEFDMEDDMENDLKENTSNTYDTPDDNDSGNTDMQEKDDSLVNNQEKEEKEDIEDSYIKEDGNNNPETVNDPESGEFQETADEPEIKDNQETDD